MYTYCAHHLGDKAPTDLFGPAEALLLPGLQPSCNGFRISLRFPHNFRRPRSFRRLWNSPHPHSCRRLRNFRRRLSWCHYFLPNHCQQICCPRSYRIRCSCWNHRWPNLEPQYWLQSVMWPYTNQPNRFSSLVEPCKSSVSFLNICCQVFRGRYASVLDRSHDRSLLSRLPNANLTRDTRKNSLHVKGHERTRTYLIDLSIVYSFVILTNLSKLYSYSKIGIALFDTFM